MKKTDYIVAELQAKINAERLSQGAPLPSTNQIARKFNVSYVTAYKAVSRLVDMKLAYRIDGKGTFVSKPESSAKTVGILWGSSESIAIARNSFVFREILLALNKRAGEKRMNIRNISLDGYHSEDLLEMDYVISVSGVWDTGDNMPLLKKIMCPHLYLALRQHPVPFCHNLCIDVSGMFRQAVEYMNSQGFFNIGFIDHCDDRKGIFMDTMRLMGRDVPSEWQIVKRGPLNYDIAENLGYEAAGKIFRDNPEMDGVISISDHMAFGVYRKAIELNKYFAVMGTDNVEGAGYSSPFSEPVLSCVATPYWQVGERAIDVLASLDSIPSGEYSHLYMPTELIKRKSCSESVEPE